MRKTDCSLLLISSLIILILSCSHTAPNHTFLDFFVGNVAVLGAGGAAKTAEIKMPLAQEDTVRTGDKSLAFVQCGADNIIQVMEKSELKLATLPDRMNSANSATSLRVLKGSAAFYVESLKEGGAFVVKVDRTTCAVRGTLFSAGFSGNAITVAVKDGTVSLKSDTNAFSEFTLASGKKVRIDGASVVIEAIGADDAKLFTDIEKVRPMAGIHCTPPEYIERFFRWRLDIVVPVTPKDGDNPRSEGDREVPSGPADGGKKGPAVRTRLLVTPLAANGVEASEAEGISRKIFSSLSAAKGVDRVVFRGSGDWRSANRILTGRVSKLGASRIIALSVADAQKGNVLFSKTVTSREGDNLDAQMVGIAGEMGARQAIWE